MVYRLAWATGLRASEIRHLVREDFDLAGTPPTVTVQAGYSKHRRRDVQPIPPELADLFRPILMTKAPRTQVFPALNKRTALMLHADMVVARAKWVAEGKTKADRAEREASDYLLPNNSQGERGDFHGLRHSFITQVVASGTDAATAMQLARHGSPELTFKRYAHVRLQKAAQSVPGLPKVDRPDEDKAGLKVSA